eukprot:8155121-Pyramimonas_sp.AAC.1
MSVGDHAAQVTECLQRAASKAFRRDALAPIKPYISRATINLVRRRRLVLRAPRDFRTGSGVRLQLLAAHWSRGELGSEQCWVALRQAAELGLALE